MDRLPQRVDVGRVIFRPDAWLVQTLESHVSNVAMLALLWQSEKAFKGNLPNLERTRPHLVRAAEIHDMAKPAHFRLEYSAKGRGKPKWEYSFAGHRFNATDDDPYVAALAHLHHEYSVKEITRLTAGFGLHEATRPLAHNFALDLYTLEMCDQLEATFARSVLSSEDPEERVFMDFQFQPRGVNEYWLDPFVFAAEPLRFTVEYAEIHPPQILLRAVETAQESERKKPLRSLQDWLVKELQSTPLKALEVSVWPWII